MSEREKSVVFTPGRIGCLEIKNRLVHSATYENGATGKGEVSDSLAGIYRNLAEGGSGLIITSITGVYPSAVSPRMIMRVDDDSFISGLAKIPWAVREVTPDCKVMLQLHHPGRQVVNREDAAKFRARKE
jgi:2,4-dienoyl-CoA reductase-like NADH-dependent reductase (Old Yellow Enzyme family)